MENLQAVNNFVAAYLKKKGFKEAEQLLEDLQNKDSNPIDFHNDPELSKFIHHFAQSEDDPAQYQDGMSCFVCYIRSLYIRSWIWWPKDICKKYSYDLLLQYLHKTQSTAMLGVINEHINFRVSSGQPTSISDDGDVVSLIGSFQDTANQINQKEVHWGLLEDSLEERLEKAGGLLSDSEKTEGENKEGDVDETKKRSVESGKQGASTKKMKKDKAASGTAKSARPEANAASAAPRVKPELTLPVMYFQPAEVEQSILEDLRNRVQLSSVALPSVWDMAKLGQQSGSCK
ncbi:transcription initiation factor TFIID subunit 5-like isoform 2 [Corchorus olitorius]|uniref:Transcription initiation factor TFIID subunit 5-like isoform 2 n=1 Tax=Corchorus olitorius TaxID=93759 RepID=A0A1R3J7A7_9ROSI|nr:transcription initiation factor TFIID subunit 5-like isoform 2 [Corchorus olitorius]